MYSNIYEYKEKIYFSRTKEYFLEVEKSFYNGNYRSAIVMLYSIVIADLLYKLEELRDYYSDKIAEQILKEIDGLRIQNPKSSEWENKLIEKIKVDTNILDEYVLQNIEYLKMNRNFCAHPSLDQNNELITPTRETTYGCIENMLLGIFIRPPLFIKKITENILEDISDKKEVFLSDRDDFKKYIENKYYKKINDNMFIGIFRDFWKLTFKTENDDCNTNRIINTQFLIMTMKEYEMLIFDDININKDKYNNISHNEEIAKFLIEFIYYFPHVYKNITDDNKIALNVVLSKKNEYKCVAYYISSNLEEHIKSLNCDNLINDELRKLFEFKINEEKLNKKMYDGYIEIALDSTNFYSSDIIFEKLILPNIKDMSEEQIIKILEVINSNSQISQRNRAEYDNNFILEKTNSNIDWKNIDLTKYPKFKYSKTIFERVTQELPF